MKNLYIPPVLIAYCIGLMIMLFLFIPKFNMIVFPYNLPGIFIAFSGVVLMGKARDLFKKYQTTLKIEKSINLMKEYYESRK